MLPAMRFQAFPNFTPDQRGLFPSCGNIPRRLWIKNVLGVKLHHFSDCRLRATILVSHSDGSINGWFFARKSKKVIVSSTVLLSAVTTGNSWIIWTLILITYTGLFQDVFHKAWGQQCVTPISPHSRIYCAFTVIMLTWLRRQVHRPTAIRFAVNINQDHLPWDYRLN